MDAARQGGTTARALVDAALGLLEEGGIARVQARVVVAEAGLTTMALYTTFGGLPGLLVAMCDTGFARLAAHLRDVDPSDDPVEDLFAMALVYRGFALARPRLYELLFGMTSMGSMRGSLATHNPQSGSAYRASFELLDSACHRAIRSGRLRSVESDSLAAQTWSFVHGFVSLEIGGHFEMFDDPLDTVLAPLAVSFMVGRGDRPDLATASSSAAIARVSAMSRAPSDPPGPG